MTAYKLHRTVLAVALTLQLGLLGKSKKRAINKSMETRYGMHAMIKCTDNQQQVCLNSGSY